MRRSKRISARFLRAVAPWNHQVADCVEMSDLTRFMIKEKSGSKAFWTRKWATESLARRFVSAGMQSASHNKGGLSDPRHYETHKVETLSTHWVKAGGIRGILGAGEWRTTRSRRVYQVPSGKASAYAQDSDVLCTGGPSRCWCMICIPKPVWPCTACSQIRAHSTKYGSVSEYGELSLNKLAIHHFSECDSVLAQRYRNWKEKRESRMLSGKAVFNDKFTC